MNYCNNCGNKILNNATYCNNCGNKLNNSNIINTPRSNKKQIITTVIICLVVIGLFSIISGGVVSSKYYFSNQENNNSKEEETFTTAKKKSKNSTVIVVDNTYYGMSIKNLKDANKLIIKDSTDQKNNCPKEILKIENELINTYNITAVNLCEMDVGFAKELENVFKKIYDEYPAAREHITNLTLRNTSLLTENGVIAAFMPMFLFADSDSESSYPWVIKTQVLLSSGYFLNKDRLLATVQESSNSGHFPPNTTIYSPVAHELGHYLSFLAMMKHYNVDSIRLVEADNVEAISILMDDFASGDHSLDMIKEAYNNYKKTTDKPLPLDEWRGTISAYALAKDKSGEYIYDETIAESFHDVYLNSSNAAEASKFIVDVLKKRLGE